jgi:hypothetical protein
MVSVSLRARFGVSASSRSDVAVLASSGANHPTNRAKSETAVISCAWGANTQSGKARS